MEKAMIAYCYNGEYFRMASNFILLIFSALQADFNAKHDKNNSWTKRTIFRRIAVFIHCCELYEEPLRFHRIYSQNFQGNAIHRLFVRIWREFMDGIRNQYYRNNQSIILINWMESITKNIAGMFKPRLMPSLRWHVNSILAFVFSSFNWCFHSFFLDLKKR